jgi:hypothetical protein
MHTASTAPHAGALPCATLWSPNPKLAPAAGNTLGLLGVSTGLAATLGAVSQVNSDPAVLAQVSCPCHLPACCLAGLGGWVARLTGHQPAPHLPTLLLTVASNPARLPWLTHPPTHPSQILGSLGIGGAVGATIAKKMAITDLPQMVGRGGRLYVCCGLYGQVPCCLLCRTWHPFAFTEPGIPLPSASN